MIELVNVRLVDVRRGCYFDPAVRLILDGGRIAAMPGLPNQPVHLPVEARFDLGGRALIPGLFNTHGHLYFKQPSPLMGFSDFLTVRWYAQRQLEKSLRDCLACGVTHFRDTLAPDLRQTRNLVKQIACGQLAGPRLVQSVLLAPPGGAFTQPANWLLNLAALLFGVSKPPYHHPASGALLIDPTAAPAQVRAAVDCAIDERGAQAIKFYDQLESMPMYQPGMRILSQAQLDTAADQCRRRGVPCTMHHTSVDGFRRGVRAGVTSLAHLPLDALLTPKDVSDCKAAGVILEPTVTIAYYYAWRLPGAAWNDHPRLARLETFRQRTFSEICTQFLIPAWAPITLRFFERAARSRLRLALLDVSQIFDYWGRLISTGMDNLIQLYTGGVLLACGNDVGANPASEAMIQLELALLDLFLNETDACFTPPDALRVATWNSARTLGIDSRFGSLEPGKAADLVALDGDPLQNARLIGAPAAAVWVDGRLVVDLIGLKPVRGRQ